MKDSGIYRISFKGTPYYYWGKSSHFKQRKSSHFCLLKNGKHNNSRLQACFNKYGEETFVFEKIVICEDPYMTELEQKLIDRDFEDPNCINLSRSATVPKISEEGRLRVAEAMRTRIISEETRRKMSESRKGKSPWNKGIPTTEEQREKLKIARNKRPPYSEETKKKQSESITAWWKSRRVV